MLSAMAQENTTITAVNASNSRVPIVLRNFTNYLICSNDRPGCLGNYRL